MKIKKLLVLLATVLVGGCATTGNQTLGKMTPDKIKETFHQGMTKQQVTAVLGDPNKVEINANNDDAWYYVYKKSSATGEDFISLVSSFHRSTKDATKELVFVFHHDRVVKYAQTYAQGKSTSGFW